MAALPGKNAFQVDDAGGPSAPICVSHAHLSIQFYFGARYLTLAYVICNLVLFNMMTEINCNVCSRGADTDYLRGLLVGI